MSMNPIGKAVKAVWNMKKTLPLTVNLMRDTRVNRINKIIFVFVTFGYLIFPYDFIFDFPIFGQLDDLAIFLYMLNWFIQRTPKAILEEYGWKEESIQKKGKKGKNDKTGKDAKDAKKTSKVGILKQDKKDAEKEEKKSVLRLKAAK